MPPGLMMPMMIKTRQDNKEDSRVRESEGSAFDWPLSLFFLSLPLRPQQLAFLRPTVAVKSNSNDNNVIAWLQHEVPHNIVLKVIACAGPKRIRALSPMCWTRWSGGMHAEAE